MTQGQPIRRSFITTAWRNGNKLSTGSGYGLKIKASDRDYLFEKTWKSIFLYLENEIIAHEINIAKKSMWDGACRELICWPIGAWLIKNGYATWPLYKPPTVIVERLEDKIFRAQMPKSRM